MLIYHYPMLLTIKLRVSFMERIQRNINGNITGAYGFTRPIKGKN